MKQSPARIFIIAFGIVVSSSCGAQGSVSSDLSYSADNIWGFDFNGDPRVVDTSIKRIRKKLPENTDIQLKSVYGVGYKVEVGTHA